MNSWDGTGAAREYQRALALDPGNVDARHLYAILLLNQARYEEAALELTRTLAADPLLAEANVTFGRLHLSLGQPDQALPYLREAVELTPVSIYARVWLGHGYLQLGKHNEAIGEFEIAAATGDAGCSAQLAYAYAVSGRRSEAMAILQPLLAPAEGGYTPPFSIAMACVGLGDLDAAFHWLERAYSEVDPWLQFALTSMRAFEPLRTDPRFAELLQRIGLTPATRN